MKNEERFYLRVTKHGHRTKIDAETAMRIKDMAVCVGVINEKKYRYFYVRDAQGRKYQLSRYALKNLFRNVSKRAVVVDHINRETSDNRRENLRWVSQWQNTLNRQVPRGKSNYRNIYIRRRQKQKPAYAVAVCIRRKTFVYAFPIKTAVKKLAAIRDAIAYKYHPSLIELNFPNRISEYKKFVNSTIITMDGLTVDTSKIDNYFKNARKK